MDLCHNCSQHLGGQSEVCENIKFFRQLTGFLLAASPGESGCGDSRPFILARLNGLGVAGLAADVGKPLVRDLS